MTTINLQDWKRLSFVPEQSQLWNSNARFVCVVAPRQSGKSLICFRKIILEAMSVRGYYIYVLPTVNQARKVCWKRMCEMLAPLQSHVLAMNKSELAFYFKNGSVLTLESGEKRERIEGISITGCIIDESSDQLPGLFDLTVLPAMSQVPNSWVWRVGVPKSNGVGGQDFKETCEKYGMLSELDDQYAYIHWTYANESFREVLRHSLDEKGFREQAMGKWAKYAGGCYYAFADDNLLLDEDYKIKQEKPILFGFDFNVDWYSIVCAQYIDNIFYVFDEIRLSNANTRTALDKLVAKYAGKSKHFIAYGDATGRARKTSADISDYLQIEAEKRIPMQVIFPRSNPSVVYRIERVNSFLKTVDETIRLMISPKCKFLIKDLYSVTWKENSREQDTKNPALTHMSDALGYLLICHEENFGNNKVLLMRDKEIMEEVEKLKNSNGKFAGQFLPTPEQPQQPLAPHLLRGGLFAPGGRIITGKSGVGIVGQNNH
ncbi:hypothetical protein FACS1894189_3750 [Planctomycetales bacterium]|nr:hypothetical protein FACS1894189_3750 [Planctomycetales bacterium]